MINSKVSLEMKDKKGKTIFFVEGRKSKVIKNFVQKSIKEKWVLKSDVFWVIKNTVQFQNIWEFFKMKGK